MQFGLLYEIEVPRPWTETSVSDGFWEALEQVKVAEEVGFSHVFSVDADAAARAGEGATWYANLVELVYASLGTLSADQSYAWYRDRIAREAYRERDLQELVDRRSVIVGGARRCIESIEWYESQGVDLMLFLRHDDIVDSLRRFGREVLPHFAGRRRPRAAG